MTLDPAASAGALTVASADADAPLVLALDIGSSSVRTLLFDARGRRIQEMGAQETYTLRTAAGGVSEDDSDAALERAARCIDALLEQVGPLAGRIGAVAVATLVSTILAVDAAGRPLTPIVTYADTRSDADAASLRRTLDEAAVRDRTGCPLRASYWPARLAWFQRTQPETRAAARWITLGEYLELRLFGRCRVSLSVASWGGLLDRRRLVWDAPLLAELGISARRLSPLNAANEPLTGLMDLWAARWPALRSVPWFAAVADGAAANVGSSCIDPARFALTVGTTGAMRVALRGAPQVPQGLWCYRIDDELSLLGGATSEGGNVHAWVRGLTGLGADEATEAAVAAFPPGGHGLTMLPFFAGERSPGWASSARATIHGLAFDTTPVAILRAGMEAVAYRFALIRVRLQEACGGTHTLIASGSALLRSPAWMQIFADVLGQPLVASGALEATSRGSALLALRALGTLPSLAVPAADGTIYEPDAARHALYQEAIARQQELYARIVGAA